MKRRGWRARLTRLTRWFVCTGSVAVVASASAQGVPAPPAVAPPPAEAFYRAPDIERALLSPSGRWLALTTGAGGNRVSLAVFDVKEWKAHAVAARFDDADVSDFRWIDDDRLVFDLEDRTRGSGDQPWLPGVWVASRDGSSLRQLVRLDPASQVGSPTRAAREMLDYNHLLLHVPQDGSGEVVIGEYRFDTDGLAREVLPKRLNVQSGRAYNIARNAPAGVQWWLFDPRGEPRVAITRSRGRSVVHWRAPGGDDWRPLAEFDALEAPFRPRFVDAAGVLYVTTNDGPDGIDVLRRFDFAAGRPEADPMVTAPGFDFSGSLVIDPDTSRTLGVRLTTDAESTVWFDPRMAAVQQAVDRRWPDRINRLSCRRCGEPDMVTLVYGFRDSDPGQFWVHERGTDRWRKLGDRRNGVRPQQMASTSFERIRARDGLEIPVWITKTQGAGPRPAVVLVHGGPWLRGRSWAWDEDARFLASRGYVVIEPEFRGSLGYGQKLYRAGWKQWGQAMQDDLIDALSFAVGKGWVDPKRVCIAGASYGGYATLMGLARHGDHFRCGVAWAGVTDPRLMFRWRYRYDVPAEYREHSYPRLIGDPEADREMLDANTPVLLADRIKAPLLLAHGSDDHRVPIVHGQRMRDALAAVGRPPEWVVYPGEGHGWLKLSTRLDFARRVENFLARHLQP